MITNAESKEKPGIGCDYTFARVAIVDPELMASMPPKITASTGFDTLAHAIEAYTSTLATPITDLYCEEAIRLVGRYLRRAVKNGADREARNGMAFANTLAGFSIAVGIVTVCHGLAHSVGGVANTTHGESLAAMTPQTMRFSMRANPDKFKKIGMLLRDENALHGQNLLEESVVEVEKLIRDIGLDTPLSRQGVKSRRHRADRRRRDPLHGRLHRDRPRAADEEGPARHPPEVPVNRTPGGTRRARSRFFHLSDRAGARSPEGGNHGG